MREREERNRRRRATLRPFAPVALGLVLALIAAGSATSVTADSAEVQVDVPLDGALPECSDLIDNDLDDTVDLDDPDCQDAADPSEQPTPPGEEVGSRPGPDPAGPIDPAQTISGATGAETVISAKPHGKGAKAKRPPRGLFGKESQRTGGAREIARRERERISEALRNPDGSPTDQNPGLTVAQFAPAPIGVPNFVIDSFEIPPFLLPIYQSCGTEYGIPWQVLASINKIETAFGTNLNVSSAGAEGWMQFIPSTWRAYGVDANDDGRKDPYNPVDAICAAARYLHAAGGDEDLREAIFAYNHADWYVDEVIFGANQYGKLPEPLVGSLTGLTEGAHFPVAADSRYADDIDDAAALKRSETVRGRAGNAADVVASDADRRSINIYSRSDAPVVAVNDGVITKIGESPKLGKFIVLTDVYGNRYTYSRLGEISKLHAVPRQGTLTSEDLEVKTPRDDQPPRASATAGHNPGKGGGGSSEAQPSTKSADPASAGAVNTEELRSRIFALPERPANRDRSSISGQLDELLDQRVPGYETFKSAFSAAFRFDSETMELRPLKVGSHVSGGSVIGKIGEATTGAPHLNFAIRPAGRGAPTIDPKPILDGWKLLETTAIYRAAAKDPFGANASVGQVLLMSKAALERRVLADPRLSIYACGRQDIESGGIDRRILAAMEYLVAKGYRLTITSLHCGHSYLTASGNVSAHSYGAAVDIAAVNGIPILGNQGPGTLTEAVIRDLMLLQGTMRPAQIISLMELGPPTFALADHDDHIHLGYTFSTAQGLQQQLSEILGPEQWPRLIQRLGEIQNPSVPPKPSAASLPAKPADTGPAAGGGGD